jgi:hypothetical protein
VFWADDSLPDEPVESTGGELGSVGSRRIKVNDGLEVIARGTDDNVAAGQPSSAADHPECGSVFRGGSG